MIRKVALATTGIEVSCIGLGTVKFGRNQGVRYPSQFTIPDDGSLLKLLKQAHDAGINFLDTAPAYGSSEERLGNLLKGKRNDWVICTKVGEEFVNGQSYFDFSSKAVTESIDRSLKRLNTDFLDIVLIHSNGDDKKIIESDILETLQTSKKLGKIRAYGMSSKTVEGGMLAAEVADVVMVTYNPMHKHEQPVIAKAYANNKGVIIKKGLNSGNFSDPDFVAQAMSFIFKEPGVHSVIIGTINSEHLSHNINCVEKIWKNI